MPSLKPKKIIGHCSSLLGKYNFGISIDNLGRSQPAPISLVTEWDPSEPLFVDEEKLLSDYLIKNQISDEKDKIFISEVFKGCIRYRKMLDSCLQLFYVKTGARYLQSEYNLFAVICYLSLMRLNELGFSKFATFIQCFDPTKMARIVEYLFSPSNLNGQLKESLCNVFDIDFVNSRIIEPITKNLKSAQTLLKKLCELSENGQMLKKTEKQVTIAEPFLLTEIKPRKVPQPEIIFPKFNKATKIMKSTFIKEQELLNKSKLENKEKSKQIYKEAQEKAFSLTTRKPSDKITQLKLELDRQELESIDKNRVSKSFKSININPSEPVVIKHTTATILREESLIRKMKQDEQDSARESELLLRDGTDFQNWKEMQRQKDEEERLLDIERKRLQVQLVHEEALIAKQEKLEENKEIVKEVLAENELMKEQAQALKKQQDIENKNKIEIIQTIQLGIEKAKKKVADDKIKMAENKTREMQELKEQAQKEAELELARKMELIQHIRAIEKNIPAIGTVIKTVDLTETSGVGLLTEMSIIELQERLLIATHKIKEMEESKRKEIFEIKEKKQDDIKEKWESIQEERHDRKVKRDIAKKTEERELVMSSISLEENVDLKMLRKKLELKKKTRISKDLQNKALEKCTNLTKKTNPGKSWSELEDAESAYAKLRALVEHEH